MSKKPHPHTLWHLCYTYIFITFAFGTVNSLLVLCLREHWHFSQEYAYGLFAAFNSLVFTLPIVGGYLAEVFGYRLLTFIGIAFCTVGAAILSVNYLLCLYAGMALFAFGLAICATTSYCLVDFAYSKTDKRRDSAFTLFYLIFNIGFLTSVLSSGFLRHLFGFQAMFFLAAIASTVAFLLFIFNSRFIKSAEGRAVATKVSWHFSARFFAAMLLTLIIAGICLLLLKHVTLADVVLWALAFASAVFILWMAFRQKEKVARLKLFAFLMLCFISVAFWSLYMLEPSLLTIFIKNNVDRHIFGYLIPASSFYSLDSLYVITFGLVLSWLWRKLASRGKDLSLPTKFALSLLSMGFGYWVFVLGIHGANGLHLVGVHWIFIGYFFLSAAELLIAPIGLSMVGRLSPRGSEGVLMGIWQVFIGWSAIISGYLADLGTTPKGGLPAQTNPIFAHALFTIGSLAVAAGVVAVCLIPLIKKLIGGR